MGAQDKDIPMILTKDASGIDISAEAFKAKILEASQQETTIQPKKSTVGKSRIVMRSSKEEYER